MNDCVNVVIEIIKSKEITKALVDLSVDIGESYCTQSPLPAIYGVIKTAGTIGLEVMTIPDKIFWSKFARFLQGTFRNEEYRIKFIEAFSKINHDVENDNYYDNVRRLIMHLDGMTDDTKIDYCANLTRSYCNGNIDGPLYFKLFDLVNSIDEYTLKNVCTYEKDKNYDLDILISTLILQGVFEPTKKDFKYKLSSLGLMLLTHGLLYNDEIYESCDYYNGLSPLNHDSSPMRMDEDGNITFKG